MNPALLDPNNHAPEVSPDDGWGDAEGSNPEIKSGPANVLPPRRIGAERTSGAAVESSSIGLRIGPNPARPELADSPLRLEVQEINGAVVRLEQTTSAPARFPRRITFQERPPLEASGNKSPDESLQWGVARRRPNHWILGAGAAVVLIVVVGMMVLPAINAPNAARPVPDAKPFVEEKIEGIEALNELFTRQSEAMRMFRAYATATRVEDAVPMLRNGSALKETLQANWRPLEVPTTWQPAADSTWSVFEMSGHPCALLQGTFPDHSKFSAFFTSEGNRLQLDWKATAGFGTATFEQLAERQGDPAEIRGQISSADYYNGIFPEAEYQSYRLISPDGESSIWCYGRRGEAANDSITPLLNQNASDGNSKGSPRITLRLEPGPIEAQPNQWRIGEMLHPDWVTP